MSYALMCLFFHSWFLMSFEVICVISSWMVMPVLSSSFPCSVRLIVEWAVSFSLSTFFLLSRFFSVCGSICGGWGFSLIVSSRISSAVLFLSVMK